MNAWIEHHPYMFMILLMYAITSVNVCVSKIAESKQHKKMNNCNS